MVSASLASAGAFGYESSQTIVGMPSHSGWKLEIKHQRRRAAAAAAAEAAAAALM
jgi:hypothetical protein